MYMYAQSSKAFISQAYMGTMVVTCKLQLDVLMNGSFFFIILSSSYACLSIVLFRTREVPTEYLNIPYQAMECFLTGIKPLGLVTAYFDLSTSKQ